jgi:hypothetical protein
MRTTMILDDGQVKDLMDLTGAKTRTDAVKIAVAEFIRRRKRERLKALSGKLILLDNWRELEELEVKEQGRRGGHR